MGQTHEPMSKDRARAELVRLGLKPSERKLGLLVGSLVDDEVLLEGIEGEAACPDYLGSAMLVLTNRRVVLVCEPNWVSGLIKGPLVEQFLWRDLEQVDAQPNGLLRLLRSGASEPLSITFRVGSKHAEAFLQLGARIRNTAEAARTAKPEAQSEPRVGELERLADLHRSGALTEEEFRAAKARLLDL